MRVFSKIAPDYDTTAVRSSDQEGAAMSLHALGEPAEIDGWGVTFAMTQDGNRVRCHVGGDALEDIENAANPGAADRMAIFNRNRGVFEAIASRLYAEGYEPRVKSKHLVR